MIYMPNFRDLTTTQRPAALTYIDAAGVTQAGTPDTARLTHDAATLQPIGVINNPDVITVDAPPSFAFDCTITLADGSQKTWVGLQDAQRMRVPGWSEPYRFADISGTSADITTTVVCFPDGSRVADFLFDDVIPEFAIWSIPQ